MPCYLIKEKATVEYSLFVHADSEEEALDIASDVSFDERYGETIDCLSNETTIVEQYRKGYEFIPVIENGG